MITLEYGRTMARYNAWMNDRLYDCCAGIPDAERKRDARAFFRSIHGTLNHLLLADRVWMGRFTGRPFTVPSLAHELHAEFDELRADRRAMDRAILEWTRKLDAQALAGELVYTSIVDQELRRMPLALALVHFFNHQAHHRGQLTTLLSQRGIDPGVTDLVAMPADFDLPGSPS